MELFSKLGYYFISFRTIQNAAVTQPGYQGISSDDDVYQADDGALREANIYVVVFKEGICTVGSHFIIGFMKIMLNDV
jgi:magnesium transporter